MVLVAILGNINLNYEGTNTTQFWVLQITGFILIVVIGKSKFLYRILERTDPSTITFYNNFFGLKLNTTSYSLDSIECIRTKQDQKNYFLIELVQQNGKAVFLGKFPVRTQLESFEQLASELIKK